MSAKGMQFMRIVLMALPLLGGGGCVLEDRRARERDEAREHEAREHHEEHEHEEHREEHHEPY